GQFADVERRPPRRGDPLTDSLREARARRPVVAPHGDARRFAKALPGEGRVRLSDRAGGGGRELFVDETADVVLAENCGGKVHGSLSHPEGCARHSLSLRTVSTEPTF